ncbi:protein of unknown function [Streptococcus thermophilus]|nr:protein of unknown function [Streptococcus thermophilus]
MKKYTLLLISIYNNSKRRFYLMLKTILKRIISLALVLPFFLLPIL